jgi:uncharacterized Zn finger protein
MTEFSRTWWGQRFLDALETCTDPGRLARGRTYARNGRILDCQIEGNRVTAHVRGSVNPYFHVYSEPIYTTTVAMKAIQPGEWYRVITDLSQRAGFVTRLLMNEMPDSIDNAFADLGINLLPHDEHDFDAHCSCPDWGSPCKHIAGVYFLMAASLDSDPFLLFELRGLPRETLREHLLRSPLGSILAAELAPREITVEPDTSFYTRPIEEPAPAVGYREFWQGARQLPELLPATPPAVPALLIRKQGEYPGFWRKNASFIETMEEVYARVRAKSPHLK